MTVAVPEPNLPAVGEPGYRRPRLRDLTTDDMAVMSGRWIVIRVDDEFCTTRHERDLPWEVWAPPTVDGKYQVGAYRFTNHADALRWACRESDRWRHEPR